MTLALHDGFVSHLLKEILTSIQDMDLRVARFQCTTLFSVENSRDVPSACPVYNFRFRDLQRICSLPAIL
jgi:hypothetical protein